MSIEGITVADPSHSTPYMEYPLLIEWKYLCLLPSAPITEPRKLCFSTHCQLVNIECGELFL